MRHGARNVLLGLLACVMLACTPTADSHPEIVPADMYNYACRFTSVMYNASCLGLPPPQISYVPFGEHVAGRYVRGAPFIFVNMDRLDWITREETILHETVHYILSNADPTIGACESEEAARRATAVFANKRYTNKWREVYGC